MRDPSKAATEGSTGTFLFGHKQLKDYLKTRQQELTQLNQRVEQLDNQLLTKIGELWQIQKELKKNQTETAMSATERAAIEQQVADLKSKADATYREILTSKQEKQRLVDAVIDSDSAAKADRKRISDLKLDINRLETETAALTKAVDSTNRMRAIQVLTAEEGI